MTSTLTEKEKERFKAYKLLTQGKKKSVVATKLNKSLSWVKRTKRRFELTGSFKDKSRSGRPKKVTPSEAKRLVKKVKGKRRQSTRKTAREFRTLSGEKVSHETVRKSLRVANLYPHRPRKTTFLTEDHKNRRVALRRSIDGLISRSVLFGTRPSLNFMVLRILKTMSYGTSAG